MTDLTPLIANLRSEEGVRAVAYDDADGQPITRGSTIHGWPTVGVGHNLTVPLSARAIDLILEDDLQPALAAAQAYPWFAELNEARQLAIVDQIFNMGASTFAQFRQYQAFLAAGNFGAAGDDLTGTAWYGEVGARAKRIELIIRSGVWVTA
jgi:GH24 family phage-related lysozyme (muramidase)